MGEIGKRRQLNKKKRYRAVRDISFYKMRCILKSGNLAHFHLEWRKSNQNRMIHERNRENQTRTERHVNGMARTKT
jgi:hypothetical protein